MDFIVLLDDKKDGSNSFQRHLHHMSEAVSSSINLSQRNGNIFHSFVAIQIGSITT
jgi:hypothetical protein